MDVDAVTNSQASGASEAVYRFGDFELNAERLELRRANELVQADALVVRLLACLLRGAGQLLTKDQLVEEVWEGRAVADNAITVAVARLRKTLGKSEAGTDFVATAYGRGYRFVGKVSLVYAPRPNAAVLSSLPTHSSLPFVGRDSVLACLRRSLLDARSGHGGACLLMGEAGIGKTRAVEAFELENASQQLRVVWGYCREGSDTPPLWPFLRVVREVMSFSSQTELERAVGTPSLEELRGLLDGPTPAAVSGDKPELCGPSRYRSFDAILRVLSHASRLQPLIIVLEDLHRADSGSLELLTHLLEEIARSRVQLLVTLRPPQANSPLHPLLARVLGHRNCERIALDRLPRAEVLRYVASVLDDPTGSLGEAVYKKSEGNPFFMVELSRVLLHQGNADVDALSVDNAALDVIRQRVAQLDAEARGVLSAAAVIGRSFELSLLQQVTERAPAALMASLDDAIAAEVVVAAPDSATAFAFGHDLLRAVLYEALPPGERRHWHLRVVHALESRIAAGTAVAASDLAYHCHAALPDCDLRKTVKYCRDAANDAFSAAVYGNADVVRYLRHALEALALMPNPSPRLRMSLLLWSTVHARGCAHHEFRGLLEQAISLAQETSDARGLVQSAYMLNPHPGFEPIPGGRVAIERALSILPAEAKEGRALGLAELACTPPVSFDRERALAHIQQAEELARSCGALTSLAGVLHCKLYICGGPDSGADIRQTRDEIAQLNRSHPMRFPVAPAELAMFASVIALQAGNRTEMATALQEVEQSSRRLRHLELVWHGQRWNVLARINTESKPELLRELDKLHASASRQQIIGHGSFRAFDRAVVFRELGQSVPLDDEARSALESVESDPPGIWAMKVRAWVSVGEPSRARSLLRTLTPEQLQRLPPDRDHLGTLGHLARAVVALDAPEYAQVLYTMLQGHADRHAGHVAFYCEGSVEQLLGILALSLQRHNQAFVHFQSALDRTERAGWGLRGVELRVQLARAALSRGGDALRRQAVLWARQARAGAEQMGLPHWQQEAAKLIERIG